MRNYDMQNPTSSKASTAVEKPTAKKAAVQKRTMAMEDDFDELDSDLDDDFDDDEDFTSKSKPKPQTKKITKSKISTSKPKAPKNEDDEDVDINDDLDDDLDDIEDEEDTTSTVDDTLNEKRAPKPKRPTIKDGKLYDSHGFEAKIEKPMWKSNEKQQKKMEAAMKKNPNQVVDKTPAWQRPPSRMSVGEWFITFVVLLIPGVNILALLIWAFFSDGVQEEKKNFSKALMLFMITMTVSIIIAANMSGKLNLDKSKMQNQFNSFTSSVLDKIGHAVDEEQQDAYDNYNNLTDDDFTN